MKITLEQIRELTELQEKYQELMEQLEWLYYMGSSHVLVGEEALREMEKITGIPLSFEDLEDEEFLGRGTILFGNTKYMAWFPKK